MQRLVDEKEIEKECRPLTTTPRIDLGKGATSSQPSQSPTQIVWIYAPFLDRTSEVTKWFLCINVTLLQKN